MQKINKFLHRNIYPLFFYCLPLRKRKIVFTSYAGTQYSDSPKIISEAIHKYYPQLEIIWLMNSNEKLKNKLPNYIKVVKSESLRAAYELYTSSVWVDNCRKPLFYKKRKGQLYIQCWHGTPLKLIEADAKDRLSKRYHKYAERDTKNIDIIISGNEYSTSILKRAFKYNGSILEYGTPRNDILLNIDNMRCSSLRKEIGGVNKKLILYAPTFRNKIEDNGIKQIEKLEIKKLLNAFEVRFNVECKLLLRFHPNVANKINMKEVIKKYDNKVVDVSIGWDMRDLLCITDALITDYSSVFFDYAILHRPIFLFTPDKDEYCEERGLYLRLNELPICTSDSIGELIECILNEDEEKLEARTSRLLKLIGNKENGNSTKKIVNVIIQHIGVDKGGAYERE